MTTIHTFTIDKCQTGFICPLHNYKQLHENEFTTHKDTRELGFFQFSKTTDNLGEF